MRERVPLWLGLYGASGSGKTFSAFRLATGIQRITGGDIYVIDTEARRALAVADRFKFRHVPFEAPFSPLDYLAAVEHCLSRGARVIVIDSMSHEHEGPGGVLEWQAAEEERLANLWKTSRDKAKMSAWQAPKAARRRMINTLLQTSCNFVFCFRAKEKIKPPPKGERDVIQLGFMPIAGEELVYEMTATALLLPGAYGVPTWHSKETGEAMMIKRPEQFRELIKRHDGQPLSEDMGEAMARWAQGDTAGAPTAPPSPPPMGERASLILEALRTADSEERVIAIMRGDYDRACKERQIRKSEGERIRAYADERRRVLSGEIVNPDAEPPRGAT